MNQRAQPAMIDLSLLQRTGWALLNLVQLAYTLLWTTACICLALAVYAATGGNRRIPLRMASWLWARGLLAFSGRFEVEGLDRVDWSQPYVLVANHQSVIDICALFRAVPVPLHFLLKQEMRRVPFVSWYARAMGMVFIPRDDRRAATASLRSAAALVHGGAIVCIFPEGTRSRDGAMGPFKPGAFQVAIDAGARVLPVALEGTGAVLPPDGLFRVRTGTIRVVFGTPLPVETGEGRIGRQALAGQAHAAVAALLDKRQR